MLHWVGCASRFADEWRVFFRDTTFAAKCNLFVEDDEKINVYHTLSSDRDFPKVVGNLLIHAEAYRDVQLLLVF
jgi:hypothetical protein